MCPKTLANAKSFPHIRVSRAESGRARAYHACRAAAARGGRAVADPRKKGAHVLHVLREEDSWQRGVLPLLRASCGDAHAGCRGPCGRIDACGACHAATRRPAARFPGPARGHRRCADFPSPCGARRSRQLRCRPCHASLRGTRRLWYRPRHASPRGTRRLWCRPRHASPRGVIPATVRGDLPTPSAGPAPATCAFRHLGCR